MNEPLNLKSYCLLTCVKTIALNITVPTITFVKGTVHPKMKMTRLLKGQFTQKWKSCHHLLILKLVHTCMNVFVLNTKIFWRKFVIRPFWDTIDFHSRRKILLCFPHPSEYLPLCSERTHSYRFGPTWGWVNHDRIFIFGWTVPLRGESFSFLGELSL